MIEPAKAPPAHAARLSDRPPPGRTNRFAPREAAERSATVRPGPAYFTRRLTPPLPPGTTPMRRLSDARAATVSTTVSTSTSDLAGRRELRERLEACLREHAASHAPVSDLVCRFCELLAVDHAILWSVPTPVAGPTPAPRDWRDLPIVAEAVADHYPLGHFSLNPPPPAWAREHLEPALHAPDGTRFTAVPPNSNGQATNGAADPFGLSQYLARDLHGRPGNQWLLLLERHGADGNPALPWTDLDAALIDRLSFSLGLVLENHFLAAQSDERASYLHNMLNSMDLAVMVIEQPPAPGAPAAVSLVNRGFCEIFGVDPLEIEGDTHVALVQRLRPFLPDPHGELTLLDSLLADPTAEHMDEMVINDPSPGSDSGSRTLHRYATPARDARGQVFGRMFFFRDITYDKELERQLLHSQKMDSIGTLAGGVAHDFNHLLPTLLGYNELLKRELQDDAPRKHKLLQIEKSANRAAELTGQLLAFSRRHPTLLKVFDLNKLVTETMNMLRSTVPASIELNSDCYPKLPNIEADETQIQQVLINLVINARDALPGSGHITISSRPGFDTQAVANTSSTIYTILEVEDDGVGIPKDVLHRIFEPFYTTKEVGKGTGLGLAMVYGIVKKHNGFIEVTSALGVGTKFSVFLPSTAKALQVGQALVGVRGEHKGPRELTIMVVDDEPALREFCVAALGEMCSNILTASNGLEAIERFKEVNCRVDLVILDLTMPKMSGPECFQHLRAMDPDCRILISSGYNLDLNDRTLLKEQAAGFLPKPYDLNQLLESVERALIQSPEAPEEEEAGVEVAAEAG